MTTKLNDAEIALLKECLIFSRRHLEEVNKEFEGVCIEKIDEINALFFRLCEERPARIMGDLNDE